MVKKKKINILTNFLMLLVVLLVLLNVKLLFIINDLNTKYDSLENNFITQKYSESIFDDPNVIFSNNFGKFKYTLGNGETLQQNSNNLIVEEKTFPETPIIYGHNSYYGDSIHNISIGELINITDKTGKVSTYKVSTIDIVPNNTKLEVIDNTLYIYTCFPFDDTDGFSDQRYVITAEKL